MKITQFTEMQKAAVVSLMIEMINADGAVDPLECDVFDAICAEYAINEEIYNLGRSLNGLVAVDMMKKMSDQQKIATAQLLIRVIDADAKDDDAEIRLFNIICRATGLDTLINAMDEGGQEV